MRSFENGLSPSLIEGVAGFTAGVASTLAAHPLDVIKTRLQREHKKNSVKAATYNNILNQ